MWRRKRRKNIEITLDEIFLDASNAPAFDHARFEGRLEKPLPQRTFFSLSFVLAILIVILVARAWNLEIINGAAFAAESAHNSLVATTIFASRGIITDMHGVVLANNVAEPDGSVVRSYSVPSLSQIIGYVSYPKKDAKGVYYDTKETGVTGLEAEYNSLLAGKNGELLTEVDALGKVRSQGIVVPARDGSNLQLTIDANLEQLFAQALVNVATNQHFLAGGGVIMDVHTGAVRAIVSYPSYDSNVMASGGPASTIALYNSSPGDSFLDHAIQGYTPGSIVKPFIASGALTDGIITPNTIIDDKGFLSIPDPYNPNKSFIFKGWRALGPVNVEKAIAWSSDIFFYTVGGGFGSQKGLGIDRLDYWYHQFGFGSSTGIDLPNEASGIIPTPAWKQEVFHEPWYLGNTYDTSIGQYAVQVTPIQMARATAALANGGKLFTPTLLAGEAPVYTTVPVNASLLSVVRAGMRDGVTSALAHAINLSYLAVAAKTGTAQVGANNQYDNSWAEGFFPFDNPQYAFAVVLERGPSGAGEESVNVMQQLFDALHAENSPYVGGTATSTP